jgi:hypothetical protein
MSAPHSTLVPGVDRCQRPVADSDSDVRVPVPPPGRAPQTWGPRPGPCTLVVNVLFQTARGYTAACFPDGERQTGHRVATRNSGRRPTACRPGARENGPRPAGSPSVRLREGWVQLAARCRPPAQVGGQACLRRGAAAHPPLPLEALYGPRAGGVRDLRCLAAHLGLRHARARVGAPGEQE